MRSRPLAALAVLLAVLSTGCHYARGVGYAGSLPSGRPSFTAGTAEGYWIWQDPQGWHLRTTSDVPRHFHGAVELLGGAAEQVRPVGALEGTVRQDGPLIQFDYRAVGSEQGFDFAGAGCGRFELYIDGDTRPLRVFLGGVEESPARVPFAVCG